MNSAHSLRVKRFAKRLVRQRNMFTYLLSFILQRADRSLFRIWYAYLRWVDDIIDNTVQSEQNHLAFISRQLELVRQLYDGKQQSLVGEERCLEILINYDLSRDKQLRNSLSEMLETIRFELQRKGAPVHYETLNTHFKREVLSYLSAIAYFTKAAFATSRPPGAEAAFGAKLAHILRDFIVDCRLGQYNISLEELAAYNLTVNGIEEDGQANELRKWAAAKTRIANSCLTNGLFEANSVRGFRYRFMVGTLIAKYQAYLDLLAKNDFDLRISLRISPLHFAKHLVMNLATIILRNRRNPNCDSIRAKAISPLVARGLLDQGRLLWMLNGVSNARASNALKDSLRSVAVSQYKIAKLKRRFLAAYWLGRSSYNFINPRKTGKVHPPHDAGLLYAFWALSVIELDALFDETRIAALNPKKLARSWFEDIARVVHQPDLLSLDLPSRPSSHFGSLSRSFERYLILHCSAAQQLNSRASQFGGHFLESAETFLMGQAKSQDQKLLGIDYDWRWYNREVINQKTLGFFLAPLGLWCFDQDGRDRLAVLQEAFLALNAGYLHWQLLDDVADISSDAENGLITAPGYILLSQGTIARKYLNSLHTSQGSDRLQAVNLESDITNSTVLCEWFLTTPLLDSYRHLIRLGPDGALQCAIPQVLISYALANTVHDLTLSVDQLCRLRHLQANQYLNAMKSRDATTAVHRLRQSGTPQKILLAVREDSRRAQIAHQLSRIRSRELLDVLSILELLMLRSHHKAEREINDG